MRNLNNIITTTIVFGLGCVAISPMTHALTPPPDGGYPHGNTAEGQNALSSPGMISGYNTAVGFESLTSLTDAGFSTAVGAGALFASRGEENTATGAAALINNTTGGFNTANGTLALLNNTMGSNNVALGYAAGSNATGSNNIYIGAGIEGFAGDSGVCRIGSINNATISNGTAVFVNADNRLGTVTSSKRFKENITPTSKASDVIYELQPVRFQYRKEIDPEGKWQFGLVAEDVEKVNPDLVVRDKEGKPYSVRYDQVNAMLLNEFLKEHKKVEQQRGCINELNSRVAKQDVVIARQQKGMEVLSAQIQKQALQMQKVSAQIAVRNPPAKKVADNQ